MRTLNYVVLVLVLVSFGFVSFGCGDSDSPTAPSSASSTTMAEAPSFATSSTSVRTTPASFDADNLRPDARGWNAYDFDASYDGRMLRLVLEEGSMARMREASKPHRNRLITVSHCPVEPHHSLQACGDPIWQATMRLAGRLELDPIPLASCEGWIVVNAAELYDDKYDGWRNAPCPTVDDDAVSSDGTGSGWPEYPPLPPRPDATPSYSVLGTRDPDLRRAMVFWVDPSTNEVTYLYLGYLNRDPYGEFGECPSATITVTVRIPGGDTLLDNLVEDYGSTTAGNYVNPATTTLLSDMPQPVYPLTDVRRYTAGYFPSHNFNGYAAIEYRRGDDPAYDAARTAPWFGDLEIQRFSSVLDGPSTGGVGYVTEGLDITFNVDPPGCLTRVPF